MEEIKKHSVKITIGTVAAVVIFLVIWSVRLWWFINKVEANTRQITSVKYDVKDLNNTVIETRNDVKRLVENAKNR